MNTKDRTQLFDDWATNYDEVIQTSEGFPFDGYTQVLDGIVELANIQSQMQVLDLGTGTGNLVERLVAGGCTVWGVDFSSEMLAKAQIKFPQVKYVQVDLLSNWSTEIRQRFDRVVSAYAFHEFDLSTRVSLLKRIARHHLTQDGYIVIGDIAFSSVEEREQAHKRWAKEWDEEEYYWAADEAIESCESVGFEVTYTQISACGGVFTIKPVSPRQAP